MHLWDIVALVPVIQGAGGVITSWSGGAPLEGDGIIASNPALHGQVLGMLNGKQGR